MKASSTPRFPLRRIVMALLAVPVVALAALEFEAASLTEATLRLAEWRVHFQPAFRVTIEELTCHSAWLRREKGSVDLGVRQTLSTRDLDGTARPRWDLRFPRDDDSMRKLLGAGRRGWTELR